MAKTIPPLTSWKSSNRSWTRMCSRLARTLHGWDPKPDSLLSIDLPEEILPKDLLGWGIEDAGEDAA